jgi:hypothetical protein
LVVGKANKGQKIQEIAIVESSLNSSLLCQMHKEKKREREVVYFDDKMSKFLH